MGMGMMGGGMGGCMCGGKSTHPFDLLTNTHTHHTHPPSLCSTHPYL